jgi:hypothetical protein
MAANSTANITPRSNASGKSHGKRYASYYGHLPRLTNRKLIANIPAKVDHPQTQLETINQTAQQFRKASSAFVRMQQDGFSYTKIILPPLRSGLRSELAKSGTLLNVRYAT